MFKPFNQKLEEFGLSEHLENIKLTPPPSQMKLLGSL